MNKPPQEKAGGSSSSASPSSAGLEKTPKSHGSSCLDETVAFKPRFDANGLIAAVATDDETGRLLMLAWMNKEALELTLKTGQAHYWSRSRKKLWRKGETSGHFQTVKKVRIDCDQDAVQLIVDQSGAACHTGRKSCFYRVVKTGGETRLEFEDQQSC